MFFAEIPNTRVLVNTKGSYSEHALYVRAGAVYLRKGATYHAFTVNNSVHGMDAAWIEIAGEYAANLGRNSLNITFKMETKSALKVAA